MKTKWISSLSIVALSGVMWAQNPPADPAAPPRPRRGRTE